MALIHPQSWNDAGMDWSNPDPLDQKYYETIFEAEAEDELLHAKASESSYIPVMKWDTDRAGLFLNPLSWPAYGRINSSYVGDFNSVAPIVSGGGEGWTNLKYLSPLSNYGKVIDATTFAETQQHLVDIKTMFDNRGYYKFPLYNHAKYKEYSFSQTDYLNDASNEERWESGIRETLNSEPAIVNERGLYDNPMGIGFSFYMTYDLYYGRHWRFSGKIREPFDLQINLPDYMTKCKDMFFLLEHGSFKYDSTPVASTDAGLMFDDVNWETYSQGAIINHSGLIHIGSYDFNFYPNLWSSLSQRIIDFPAQCVNIPLPPSMKDEGRYFEISCGYRPVYAMVNLNCEGGFRFRPSTANGH